jgi:hypothetical protein
MIPNRGGVLCRFGICLTVHRHASQKLLGVGLLDVAGRGKVLIGISWIVEKSLRLGKSLLDSSNMTEFKSNSLPMNMKHPNRHHLPCPEKGTVLLLGTA